MENKKRTFQHQYNKIVSAYMKNELEPMTSCACFVGNLLNNNSKWSRFRGWKVIAGHPEPTEDTLRNCKEYWLEGGGPKSLVNDSVFMRAYNYGSMDIHFILNRECQNLYSFEEILELETQFLKTLAIATGNDEERLYQAMESTLLMLKEIHESKGEVVPDYNFEQRHLSLQDNLAK